MSMQDYRDHLKRKAMGAWSQFYEKQVKVCLKDFRIFEGKVSDVRDFELVLQLPGGKPALLAKAVISSCETV